MPELYLLDDELRLNACAHLDRPLTVPMGEGGARRWTRLAPGTQIAAAGAVVVPKVVWHLPFGRPRVLVAQVVGALDETRNLVLTQPGHAPETWFLGALTPSTDCPNWLRRVVRHAGETLDDPTAMLVGPFRRRGSGEAGYGRKRAFFAGSHISVDTPFVGLWTDAALLRYWACPGDWTERPSSPLDCEGPTGRRSRKALAYHAHGTTMGGE